MKKTAIGVAAAAAAGAAYLLAPGQEPSGHMYVMRGLFGGAGFQFSRGVDSVAYKAAKEHNLGITVKSWRSSSWMCSEAAEQYAKDKKPVFLAGHSLGANEVADVAHCLKAKGVPVAFALFYDPTPFVACVPDNVKFATSWRRSYPLDLGGGYIKRCNGSTKDISNITIPNSRHVTIDDLPVVHDGTLKRIGIAMNKGK